jgi:hypothetical protein
MQLPKHWCDGGARTTIERDLLNSANHFLEACWTFLLAMHNSLFLIKECAYAGLLMTKGRSKDERACTLTAHALLSYHWVAMRKPRLCNERLVGNRVRSRVNSLNAMGSRTNAAI